MPTATWNAEQTFRDLYTRLDLAGTTGPRLIGVTSAIDGEGKSLTVESLAYARAEDLHRAHVDRQNGQVVIVDCSGSFEGDRQLGDRVPENGLIQCLRGECQLAETITPVTRHLSFISRGGSEAEFSATVRSVDLKASLQWLRQHSRLAVLDMPSVLTTSDTMLLSEVVDLLVMVVRARATPVDLVERAVNELPEGKLAGIVLNDIKPDLPEWLDRRLS